MRRQLVGLLGLALLVGLLVGCSGAAKSVKDDAAVTTCQNPEDGTPLRAEGTITNRSSETSDFLIRVTFYDTSGNRVAEGVDTVTGVNPGEASPWQSTASNAAKGPIECKVTSARRTASPLD